VIKTVFNTVSGVAAKMASGRLSQFDADGLMIDIKLTTATGHLRSDFDNWKLSATLKDPGTRDINVFTDVRLSDLLKYSDFAGGFSMELAGDAAARYVAYIPLGNYMLEGDDALDLVLTIPGHATAVLDVNVSACDFVKLAEKIVGYESLTGNGQEVIIKDAYSVFLCTAETGATIAVKDMEREYFVTDREVLAAGNALGKMEKWSSFGALYTDGTGYGQTVRIKVPTNAVILIARGFYPLQRVGKKAQSNVSQIDGLQDKIRSENPDKYQYLVSTGMIQG